MKPPILSSGNNHHGLDRSAFGCSDGFDELWNATMLLDGFISCSVGEAVSNKEYVFCIQSISRQACEGYKCRKRGKAGSEFHGMLFCQFVDTFSGVRSIMLTDLRRATLS